MNNRKFFPIFILLALVMAFALPALAADAPPEPPKPALFATWWALVPPVVAIVLALATKEVYSSLFFGIAFGAALYSGGSFEGTVLHVFNDGFIKVLTDPYNMGILIFLVLLGAIISLMNRAGGSAAFGRWAEGRLKTRTGAQLSTILLGVLVFVDDYFNCLTVGSVMRPITDRHNISRAKLAYLIDSTAAPICIIAPISSWAAAVSGFVEGEDGFALFVQAIPYNFYAILTIVTMIGITLMNFDFGPMARFEELAVAGHVTDAHCALSVQEDESGQAGNKGGMIDLVIPILSVVIFCVIGMIYTGGFFSGTGFVEAFGNCDASVGLSLGSFFGFIFSVIVYQVRRIISFRDAMGSLVTGINAMAPAILILTMAWSLKAMTDSLGAKEFVAASMTLAAGNLVALLPAIIFLVGWFLAFSTGTSWGTFGILIPIVVAVFQNTSHELMIISISACMAGAVCGDHCSPISDTTIMASAGAQCNHVDHVNTQLPYVIVVAAVSFVSYIIAGYTQSAALTLPIALILMITVLFLLKRLKSRERQKVSVEEV